VKPQTLSNVLEVMKKSIRPNHLVISIVAGMRIAFIQQMLGTNLVLLRTMPNIAATVDEGAAAVAFGKHVTAEQQKNLRNPSSKLWRSCRSHGRYSLMP